MQLQISIAPNELKKFGSGVAVNIASMNNAWCFFITLDLNDVEIKQDLGPPTVRLIKPINK